MTPSCVALGRVIICDLNFKRTENHNFTITTNTSQHVEFFHSLIFHKCGLYNKMHLLDTLIVFRLDLLHLQSYKIASNM